MGTGDDGRACYRWRTRRFDNEAAARAAEVSAATQIHRVGEWRLELPRPCEDAIADAGEILTPEMWVLEYLEEVPLPEPSPRINPGWGITGKLMYLEPGVEPVFVHTREATPFGPLRIDATATFIVDWGDGNGAREYPRARGGPWPDGDIRYAYADTGSYDVEVTAAWRVSWSLGGESGTLPVPLRLRGVLEGFPMRQLQAVRVQ